eukprot:6646041-Pyramimonas_sp.AAC.1
MSSVGGTPRPRHPSNSDPAIDVLIVLVRLSDVSLLPLHYRVNLAREPTLSERSAKINKTARHARTQ